MGTSLEGRVAVVTGSAMGMGKVTAKELANRGAAVACWDIVGDKVMETAEEIAAAGHKSIGLQVNVTDMNQVQQAASKPWKRSAPWTYWSTWREAAWARLRA